jgi:hypothetical protein
MRKILALILIILSIILSGCSPAIFDMNSFVLPDDMEFIQTVKELNTPEKIGQYMKDNFSFKANAYNTLSPYELWKTKTGDCNDISTFAVFIANYHGYKSYQVIFYGEINHAIALFIEEGQYTYISNNKYYPTDFRNNISGYNSFEVYDYEMNLIEVGN